MKEDLLALTKTTSELATFENVSVVSAQRSASTNLPKLPASIDNDEKVSDESKPPDSDHQEKESLEVMDEKNSQRLIGKDNSLDASQEVNSDSSIPVTKLKDIPTLLFGMSNHKMTSIDNIMKSFGIFQNSVI